MPDPTSSGQLTQVLCQNRHPPAVLVDRTIGLISSHSSRLYPTIRRVQGGRDFLPSGQNTLIYVSVDVKLEDSPTLA